MERILVFLPNWIGDVVMATPALRQLRAHVGPDTQIIGVMRTYVQDVLAGTSWLDAQIAFRRRRLVNAGQLVRTVRQLPCQTALLMTNSLSTAVIARLAGIPRRIGFAMHGRGPLLTERLYRPMCQGRPIPRSAVDHYLEIVAVLGAPTANKRPELTVPGIQQQRATQLWRTFGWSDEDPVIVLNTGGAYGAAKNWPAEYFTQLARQLVDRYAVRVLLVCGPNERTTVADIEAAVDRSAVRSLADQRLSIGLTMAAIERGKLLISTDSGPRHFAAALGVPVITLFGPTDPRWSDNYAALRADLSVDVPCGPCARRVCPEKHHRCMRELTVEQVLSAVERLISFRGRDTASPILNPIEETLLTRDGPFHTAR